MRYTAIRCAGNCSTMAWSRRWAGSPLGCAGCHENDAIAPLTAGTWTRINDIRLNLRQFNDYSHRQFLVESIVRPLDYIAPDYAEVMPEFYGGQLTIQQLADLVAFLDSQDQIARGRVKEDQSGLINRARRPYE